ncbi:MAG TPA: Holliday junction branch migration protein RuvA [Caulobacteraceae bacterium]|nr:Holliday junction branch migration protein RuvA [Caulobacteraceae bacterium]
MIGRLRGVVVETAGEDALIDVAGVGYLVHCGARTLARLPTLGEEVVLHVESQWSESAGPRLYGFLGRDERAAFVLLQQVQGVGAKVALAVLDALPPAELAGAVARQDRAMVARANGVGPRLAARIVAELKDKPIVDGPLALASPVHTPASPAGEAVAALMGLGVAEAAARRAVDQAAARADEGADAAVLVRAALRELGR